MARGFASLDHLSGGRAGWNVVTTAYAKSGAVFGRQHPPHAERYAMAEEFVEACRLLWDSWDDDAFVADKAAGRFVRPGSLHVPDFKGKYFTVEGGAQRAALAAGPSGADPGRLVGAGPGAGRAHRRRGFHGAERPAEAQAFYNAVKAQVVAVRPGAGQRAGHARRLPRRRATEAEAQAIFAELNRSIDTAQAFTVLSERLGADMSV